MKNKDKIKLLKEVKKLIEWNKQNSCGTGSGLCSFIGQLLGDKPYSTIELLTLANAIKYGNAHINSHPKSYWWGISWLTAGVNYNRVYDYDSRIAFVDWMISQYSKPWWSRFLKH